MSHLYLSLGTNIGDRWLNLTKAVEALGGLMTVSTVSPVYQTSAWGPNPDQPDYYNICVGGTTDLSAECFLVALDHLQTRLGRRNPDRHGPHRIDIDMLFMDSLVMSYGRKQLPHAGIEQRAFVLAPLLDIAPDLVHPETNVPVRRLHQLVDKSCLLNVLSEPLVPALTPVKQPELA